MITLLHAGHGMPAGHVHPSDVVIIGAIALLIVCVDWYLSRTGR